MWEGSLDGLMVERQTEEKKEGRKEGRQTEERGKGRKEENKKQQMKRKQERALVLLSWKRLKMGRRKENSSGKWSDRETVSIRGRERTAEKCICCWRGVKRFGRGEEGKD